MASDDLAQSLRRLTRGFLTEEEVTRYPSNLADQTDRAAAIIACAFLEAALTKAVGAKLITLTEAEHFDLFTRSGPLSGFRAKSLIAHALGLVSKPLSKDLETISLIRNAFAHAVRPISFDTVEILRACNKLSYLRSHKGMIRPYPNTSRDVFLVTVTLIVGHITH